jgi:hypothetical protein
MPVISTFGALSDRALGGFGGRPRGFNPSLLATGTIYTGTTHYVFVDFVIDSQGNYIGIYKTNNSYQDGNGYVIKVNTHGEIISYFILPGYLTSYPFHYITPTYITIDSSDNIYLLSYIGDLLKYDSSFNLIWKNGFGNIGGGSNYQSNRNLLNFYVSDSGVVSFSNYGISVSGDTVHSYVQNVNATTGDGISAITGVGYGSGSNYSYLATYAYCLLQNSSSAAYVFLGQNALSNAPYNSNDYFTLSIAYGANSVSIRNIVYPASFVEDGRTWYISRTTGNAFYVSDHAYVPSTGISSYYIAGICTYNASSTGQTSRFYVKSFYSLVTLVGTTPTVSNPIGTAVYYNTGAGGFSYKNSKTFIDNQGNFFSCWGSTTLYIARHNNATTGTSGIIWSTVLTCPSNSYVSPIKLKYNSVTDKLIIQLGNVPGETYQGNSLFIEVPGDGSVPSTGTYVIDGITYTYQTYSWPTGTHDCTYNTINSTTTTLGYATGTSMDTGSGLPAPTINTLVLW